MTYVYVTETQEVCDTKDILIYLNNTYSGQLDKLFFNNSFDDVLSELKERNVHYRHKRDVTAISTNFNSHRVKRAMPILESKTLDSIPLYGWAHACRYGSITLLSCMFLIVSTLNIHVYV